MGCWVPKRWSLGQEIGRWMTFHDGLEGKEVGEVEMVDLNGQRSKGLKGKMVH